MYTDPVIIIGGGLSGLCCARRLDQSQIPWLLLEASDRLGGQVRTESFESFRLDAGFQVLLTSYPQPIDRLVRCPGESVAILENNLSGESAAGTKSTNSNALREIFQAANRIVVHLPDRL